MICCAKIRSSWVEKRQPRNRKWRPLRMFCTASGMGVWMSISVSTSTKSESETRKLAAGETEPNG